MTDPDPLATIWHPWTGEAAWEADHAAEDSPEQAASRLRLAQACHRLTAELIDGARNAPNVATCEYRILMSRLVRVLPGLPTDQMMSLARAASLVVL